MTLHNYRSRQVHKTLNGVNPSGSFRDMRSAKSGPNLWQIWQVFGPWASPYGANGQITMTVHNYRPRQFHRTSNGENPSSGYRDMGSASLAAARPAARTVTTIPLQPEGLRGKKVFDRPQVPYLKAPLIQEHNQTHSLLPKNSMKVNLVESHYATVNFPWSISNGQPKSSCVAQLKVVSWMDNQCSTIATSVLYVTLC